jgi:hypothetical protein
LKNQVGHKKKENTKKIIAFQWNFSLYYFFFKFVLFGVDPPGSHFFQIWFLCIKNSPIHENSVRLYYLITNIIVPFLEDLVGHPSKKNKKTFMKFSAFQTRLDSIFQRFFALHSQLPGCCRTSFLTELVFTFYERS